MRGRGRFAEQAARAVVAPAAAPTRPAYLQVPTDLLSAEVGEAPPVPAPARAATGPASSAASMRRAPAALGRRRGARRGRRGDRAWPSASPRPCSPPTAPRACSPRRIPARSACRRTSSPSGGCGTRPTSWSSIGSDLDGVQTQNFAHAAAAAADRDQPRCRGRDEELPRRSAARGRRGGRRRARRAGPRRGLDGLAQRLHGVRSEACAALDSRALRFLDAIRFAVPDDGDRRRRHVHPRLLAGRLPHPGGAAAAADPARLGHARLRVPGRARRLARGLRAGGGGGRRRRLPVRARRARHRRAGAAPADAGDRRRRRLRDAALRPGRDGRRPLRRRPATPDFATLVRSFGLRAQKVEGLEDEFGEALAEHVPTPAPAC